MDRGLGDPRDMYVDQFCALVWFLSIKDKEPEEIEQRREHMRKDD